MLKNRTFFIKDASSVIELKRFRAVITRKVVREKLKNRKFVVKVIKSLKAAVRVCMLKSFNARTLHHEKWTLDLDVKFEYMCVFLMSANQQP